MTDLAGALPTAPRRSFLRTYWFDIPLWKRIIPALLLGVAAGLILEEDAAKVRWLGEIFIRLTRMLVVPLIFLTITAGVISMGDPKRLGSLGARALAMFAGTALIAATMGATIGVLLQPGVGVDLAGATPQTIKASRTLSEQLLAIIPVNPVQALAEGDMLAIIFFAALFGVGILTLGERARVLTEAINTASEVMMKLIIFVMETAPFGVFGLMAAAVGTSGLGVFVNVSLLAFGMVAGCLIQMFVVQAGAVQWLARLPAPAFLRRILPVQLVAFSTSSSSATLPIAIAVAERDLGLHKGIVSTVLPVGVGIARDGSALYVALLSMFAVQALGMTITPVDFVLVVAVSTLLALGAPPAPSAALFMMAAVLSVVGIGDAKSAIIVGFILPFDRLLDMVRTATNVSGNLTTATVTARWSGEIDVDVFRRRETKI